MAVQGQRSAWPSSDDATFFFLVVILVGLGAYAYLSWNAFHTQISTVFAHLIRFELSLIRLFTDRLNGFDTVVSDADMRRVTVAQIYSALDRTGMYLRLPAIFIMVALALVTFIWAPPNSYTSDLDLDGLAREHGRTYLPIRAYARRNLKLVPLLPDRLRPLDPALSATEWAARFASSPEGVLDEDAAKAALAQQLGPLWHGVEKASPIIRLFFTVFVLHLEQQREKAKDLLGEFANALPVGSPDEPAGPEVACAMPAGPVVLADEVLKLKKYRGRADEIAERHAYAIPALMSVLTEARRRSGVLAPAQFNGLKLVDRDLWWALHSLGVEGDGPGQRSHPNPRAEASGARDHWASERLAKRPLVLPHVDNALAAIRTEIGNA